MKRDATWDAFAISKNPDEFAKEIFPEIELKKEVHQDIKSEFRVIKRLVEQSYFEYQFYDKAATEALLTFEMALKMRNKELNFVKHDKYEPSLSKLITAFHKRDYFEGNKRFLDLVRMVRNQFVHRDKHNFAGPLKRQYILHSIDLINGLYEDPKLRRKRKALTYVLNEAFKKIPSPGFKVKSKDEEFICFVGWFSFVNNKSNPREIYFYFKPLFDIPDNYFEEKKLYLSPRYLIIANNFRTTDDSITLMDSEGSYEITKLTLKEDIKLFEKWHKVFLGYSDQTGEYYEIKSEMIETYEKHLREFHLCEK